jgi:hypothetical protein
MPGSFKGSILQAFSEGFLLVGIAWAKLLKKSDEQPKTDSCLPPHPF